ncbi:hypothetical protein DMI65_23610 [Escherichia coli]|nr:hypothetical protein [Escherichia coli]
MARGYDTTARDAHAVLSTPQYQCQRRTVFWVIVSICLTLVRVITTPVALSLGLNYTPVPLVTVTAQHKQGESGEIKITSG